MNCMLNNDILTTLVVFVCHIAWIANCVKIILLVIWMSKDH
uniref:Uncharacterized protein n=1 Tax=Rhizophora mucronata TaxID=61149 RepID=A0A2P2QFH5_RHIMU